ncbi:MAG: metalloregulator ArsR/SmtB family transcription factor [Trueperaceae bacterium]|nr:metalloregulator ArsR/SmtB family transcription factor [Trueperaceae bacterium]
MSDSNRLSPKQAVYERLAQVPQALSSGPRLELLDLLAQGEKTVATLARQADLSVANASQHLQVLRRAGLAAVRRDGRQAFYSLAGDDVQRLVQAVRAVGETRLAEMDRLLDALHAGSGEPVTTAELRERLSAGDTILLDVRPADEYGAGHLPGAWSIPIGELEARLEELPPDVDVVAYCRGPYCALSDRAVQLLTHSGRTARRLREGVADWRSEGLPVETASVAGDG